MLIDIVEDYDKPDGGFVIITIAKPFNGADPSLTIRRHVGEPDKLGEVGWQPYPAKLQPILVSEERGTTSLQFGPDVTRHLIEDTEVEIAVPALNVVENVVWPYITPSVLGETNRGSMHKQSDPQQERPTSATGPGTGTSGTGTTGTGEGTDGDAPETDVDEEVETETEGGTTFGDPPGGDDDPEPTPAGYGRWIAAAAVIIVALGGFWAWDQSRSIASKPSQDPETVVEDVRADPVPAVDTVDALLQEATACRGANCSGADYLDIARRLEAIDASDPAFRVMTLAADNGSVEAMMWLAKTFDPLLFEASDALQEPDLSSAFLYYVQATDAGSEEAPDLHAALCAALATPDQAEWPAGPPEPANARDTFERNCA